MIVGATREAVGAGLGAFGGMFVHDMVTKAITAKVPGVPGAPAKVEWWHPAVKGGIAVVSFIPTLRGMWNDARVGFGAVFAAAAIIDIIALVSKP